MKTLKTIVGLILLLTLTTACTDLSEDLELRNKIQQEEITTNTNARYFTGNDDGGTDDTGKDW